jgi:hypothetical protein
MCLHWESKMGVRLVRLAVVGYGREEEGSFAFFIRFGSDEDGGSAVINAARLVHKHSKAMQTGHRSLLWMDDTKYTCVTSYQCPIR